MTPLKTTAWEATTKENVPTTEKSTKSIHENEAFIHEAEAVKDESAQ